MPNTKEIVSNMETINQVMITDNNVFFIPDFQRSFVWGEEEIKQLFDDFIEDTDSFQIESNDLEGYLLGNIVLIEQEGNPCMVIDGQQRLTTITLIYRALTNIVSERSETASNVVQKYKWVQKIGDLVKGYSVVNDDDEFQSLRIMHDASLKFGSYYQKLLSDLDSGDDDIETAEDRNIYNVYNYAYETIKNLNDAQLTKFINYFRNKVKLIVTTAPTEAKAFQLFEILNDRGRSLEPMDLIKNTFLKILNQEGRSKPQKDTFNANWKATIENLQVGNKKISSSSFLKQYILAFCGDNVQSKDLFDFMKKPSSGLTQGTGIIRFADGLKKASALVNRIEKEDYSDYNNDQNMYIILKLLRIKQFYPFLILFMNADDEKKAKILDVLSRYGAGVVFSFTQTNSIEKDMPAIIKNYLKKKDLDENTAFTNLLNDLEAKTKDVASLSRTVVAERNFVGRSGYVHSKAMVVLRFIELYFNNNTKVQTIPRGKKLTVEHIQSQNMDPADYTISDLGFSDETERLSYLHKMGNLTLLYNGDNSSIGNDKFVNKLNCYKGSDFILTSTIVTPETTTQKHGKDTDQCNRINKYEKQYEASAKGHWTKKLIENRGMDMAELMYRILTNTAN